MEFNCIIYSLCFYCYWRSILTWISRSNTITTLISCTRICYTSIWFSFTRFTVVVWFFTFTNAFKFIIVMVFMMIVMIVMTVVFLIVVIILICRLVSCTVTSIIRIVYISFVFASSFKVFYFYCWFFILRIYHSRHLFFIHFFLNYF